MDNIIEKSYIEKMPSNIAKVCLIYNDEKTNILKLQRILDIFAQTVHFFGCTFLSEYINSDKVNDKVNACISKLARPSLGTWFEFVRTYQKQFKDDLFIKEFPKCFKSCNMTISDDAYKGRFKNPDNNNSNAFDEIISLRNMIAHGASFPTEEEAGELVVAYFPLIMNIIEAFMPIFNNYSVVKCDDIEELDADSKEELESIIKKWELPEEPEVYKPEMLDDEDTFYVGTFDIICYEHVHKDDKRVVFPEESFKVQYKETPDEYINRNRMYLLAKDCSVLKYTEYLLELEREGNEEHEEYFLFDGFGNKKVTYLGMKYKKMIARYLDQIKTKFTERGGAAKWNKGNFVLDAFHDYINELSSIAINQHKASRKYVPEVYIERSCDFIVDDFMNSDKTTLLVTAEAGVGKTNFLCHVGEELIKRKTGVYFYNGSSLTDTEHEYLLFRRLQEECLEDKEFHGVDEFLDFLAELIEKEKTKWFKMVIIVDAANEAYNTIELLREIDHITNRGKEYPWLKVLVSIRSISYRVLREKIVDGLGKPFIFMQDKTGYYPVVSDNETRYELAIPEWNTLQLIDAMESYGRHYNIPKDNLAYHKLSPEIKKILRNPLNLSLYFNVINSGNTENIATEQDLFRALTISMLGNEEITTVTEVLLNHIVARMYELHRNELDYDEVTKFSRNVEKKIDNGFLLILTPYERLRDCGLIYEKEAEDEVIVGFVYQKYLEYRLKEYLKKKNYSLEELADGLVEAYLWEGLPEAFLAYRSILAGADTQLGYILEQIFTKAKEKNIDKKSLKEGLMEYMQGDVLKIHDDKEKFKQYVLLLKKYDIMDWGFDLAWNIYMSDETDLSDHLTIALLENEVYDNDLERAKLLNLRARLCMKTSKYIEAEKLFRECIECSTSEAKNNALVQLAKTIRKMGKVPEAAEILNAHFDDADDNTPYYADALIQMGLCKLSDGEIQQALDHYLKALKISKEQKDYHNIYYNELGIGTAYAKLGNLDKADETFLDVYNGTSQYGYLDLLPDSLNGLASNSLRKRDFEKSIEYAERAISIWQHSRYYLGQFHMYSYIILAMVGLEKPEDEIKEVLKKADELKPYISEKVILEVHERALKAFESKKLDLEGF